MAITAPRPKRKPSLEAFSSGGETSATLAGRRTRRTRNHLKLVANQ